MKCVGCSKELEVGDRYIEGTASEFVGGEHHPGTDLLVAELLGGVGGKVVYCEDCTEEGGDFRMQTYLPEGDGE